MNTRSRGQDILFWTSDLQRAEQEKQSKQGRDRAEKQLRAEQQLENDVPELVSMADPPEVPEFPLRADQQHGGYPVHPPHPQLPRNHPTTSPF
ncbi:unnamed protein product [Microthlaspi erraticum]|uniref:Uncharacterized protein n=1 Tax=Microthlaspi erraticum TaxID=1685480 RepID=A0A6D2ISD8_9BRAS|nr:unnamed protein product [Microthlaspi erraticum]